MNVLEIMGVIICVITLMAHLLAIVIQATCLIQMELHAKVILIINNAWSCDLKSH